MYHRLKKLCKDEGHTCIKLSVLPSKLKGEVNDEDFTEALLFLTGNKIVKIYEMNDTKYVFPWNLWKCEEKICKGIMKIYKNHLENPSIVDYEVENKYVTVSVYKLCMCSYPNIPTNIF